jgi:hypothetical protein
VPGQVQGEGAVKPEAVVITAESDIHGMVRMLQSHSPVGKTTSLLV